MTTFTQLNGSLKSFLKGWLLVLGLKEGLLERATVYVKSEVILAFMIKGANLSISTLYSDSIYFLMAWRLEPFLSFKQSHYREVLRWEIFMEQKLRFGLDLGQMANFSAFIASKSFDLWNHHTVRTVNDVLEDRYPFCQIDILLPKKISIWPQGYLSARKDICLPKRHWRSALYI